MLKKLAKSILATSSILVGTALSTASPSQAVSSTVKLNSYTPSEITKVGVNSSGTAYEIKGLMDLAAEVHVVVNGGVVAHVKNWKTWLLVRTENSTWVEFSDDGVSESYPFLQRPQKIDAVVPLAVPHMTLAPVMVSYCNALANELRTQGKSNTEIFSQDRTVPIALRVHISEKFIPGYNALHQAYPNTGDISDWQKINLICKGRAPTPPIQTAGAFKPPPVDFKINDIDLFLTTFSGNNTQPNPASICKKVQVKVRLKTSKAGATKFKLWTKVGGVMSSKVIDAWASHDGNGGFNAEHTEWVSVNKPTYVQAKAEEMVSGFGSSTAWNDITLQCTNPGGGGLATNPNTGNPDNDIPQGKNVDGDFAFIDHGSPKCTRTGKALITFRSPKSDNIHYSLDCKFDNHSGVLPTVPHPDGGYAAATLVSFDVDKTYIEACTLRTVAPYGPEDHVNKTHLFQCVTPSGHSASDDLVHGINPSSSSSAGARDKVIVDVAKRRLKVAATARKLKAAKAAKVAKAAVIAKRKRDAAKKASLAITKKKRNAALKLRRMKLQQAAIKKAAAAAIAKRRANAVAQRKATLKKRVAPSSTSSSVGTTVQRRIMRRR